jgi:hypothetical protein
MLVEWRDFCKQADKTEENWVRCTNLGWLRTPNCRSRMWECFCGSHRPEEMRLAGRRFDPRSGSVGARHRGELVSSNLAGQVLA